jgi:hypothetical protein
LTLPLPVGVEAIAGDSDQTVLAVLRLISGVGRAWHGRIRESARGP